MVNSTKNAHEKLTDLPLNQLSINNLKASYMEQSSKLDAHLLL